MRDGIEGARGPGTANPCSACGRHSTQQGEVSGSRGTEVVSYHCPYCGAEWSRPVVYDIGVNDVVRADLPGAYLYGIVDQVNGDLIHVVGDLPGNTDWSGTQWVERWQILIL